MPQLLSSTLQWLEDIEKVSDNLAEAERKLQRQWKRSSSNTSTTDDHHSELPPIDLVRRIQGLERGLSEARDQCLHLSERKPRILPQLHSVLSENQRLLRKVHDFAESNVEEYLPPPPTEVKERVELLDTLSKTSAIIRGSV